MKIEDIEDATDAELRRFAVECFEQASSVDQLVSTILLRKARFFLDEIERRKNDKIGRRDFRMELVVIALISAELLTTVGLAWWGGKQQRLDIGQQLEAFGKMQDVLSHLQDSSKATADRIATLKTTTETMNAAVQKQVEFYYDVQLNIIYDRPSKRLAIINQGKSAVTIWDARLGTIVTPLPQTPELIAPNGGVVYAVLNGIYNDAVKRVPKDSTLASPYSAYIENEQKQKFTIHCTLTALWESDALIFHVLTKSISPGWDIEKAAKKNH